MSAVVEFNKGRDQVSAVCRNCPDHRGDLSKGHFKVSYPTRTVEGVKRAQARVADHNKVNHAEEVAA
ncbi:hypothetical protein ACFPZL_09605 [Leucobacter soli]|uniref:Uncharacterized protein n=1 Tax=Leucobacter soli TaxID=2812850 RepID=A0A916K341_9MICO|nr:hypothetical protein [Leucobacter soli]CAG7622394.1 hypothetical protein LEUCIP111803_02512 [Leucobacter soli]